MVKGENTSELTPPSRLRAAGLTLIGNVTNTAVVSAQALVMIPLYIHYLGASLYGAWLGAADITAWLRAFELGVSNLLIQRIGAAHGSGDQKKVWEYFSAGMAVLFVVGLLATLASVILSYSVAEWMNQVGEHAVTLRWCFVGGGATVAITFLNEGLISLSRGIQKTMYVNIVMVVSSVLGFGVSLVLLLAGLGLWSISIGLLVRATANLLGNAFFILRMIGRDWRILFQLKKETLREFYGIVPITAISNLAEAVMSNGESFLVAIILRPEAAVVLSVTRRALDVGRMLVDMVGNSAYGAFSHLVASAQRGRALEVYQKIRALRFRAALVLSSAYLAVNSSLVSVWVGPGHFGGRLLTVLFAANLIVVGGSVLKNYLFRATGAVQVGAMTTIVESAARIPLMIFLLKALGLPGLPIAGIFTAAVSGTLLDLWTRKELEGNERIVLIRSIRTHFGVLIIPAVALSLGLLVSIRTWTYVIAVSASIVVLGFFSLVLRSSEFLEYRERFLRAMSTVVP